MAMRYSVPAHRSDVFGTLLSSTRPSTCSPHRPEKTEWKLRDQGIFYGTLLTWTHSLSRFGRQRPSRAKRLMLRDSDPNIQIQVSSNTLELTRRGDAKRMLRDFAGAIADLDLALELEPENAFALRSRGEAKRRLGDFSEAIKDLDLAVELEPENARALRHRGEAKRMLDDFAGAIVDLDLALELEPENAWALRSRGEAKRRLGDIAGAVADLDLALQVEPEDAFALARRGEIKRMRGDFERAIEDLNLALKKPPKNTFALVVRSEVKRQQKDLKGAIADLDLLVDLEPRSCFAFRRRGELKQQQGDIAGAISDFESALQLDPNNPCARRGHSEALLALWVLGKQTVLARLQAGQALKWAIIGAGPVGLTLALSLAEAMWQKGMDPTAVGIEVYESRWIEELPGSNDAPKWQRKCKRPRRAQVVTLQDSVVESLSEQTQPAFAGERVWPDSQNVPVADVEERLLERAQQEPFCKYIHIRKTTFLTDEQAHAKWIDALDADVVVAADGAGSMSRRAFPNGFVCPASEGANTDAQQIRLGETTDDFEEADFALGIALKPDARPPQSQAMNVVLTLAQNVYLLNSQEGSRGFLNIRLTKEEYNAILEATGCKGCPFGSPIRLYDEMEIEDAQNEIRVKLPWLRRRIEEGLKLFGMQLDHMEFITGFQLRPAYAQCFYHVLPSQSATTSSPKVLLLAGDAAISHHFWPGRGLNTGLKSAVAMVNMWKASDDSGLGEGIKLYNAFMEKLCQREMQGRSASMMRQDMRLPWAGTLLSCKSSEAQKLKQVAKNQELSNREKFLENCKMVRDFLEKLPGWPHKHLSDDELEEKILHRVAKPKDLELHLMVLSAFDNGPGRAPGWPTSLQCGAEVDPSNKAHWIEEIQFLSSIWCGSV